MRTITSIVLHKENDSEDQRRRANTLRIGQTDSGKYELRLARETEYPNGDVQVEQVFRIRAKTIDELVPLSASFKWQAEDWAIVKDTVYDADDLEYTRLKQLSIEDAIPHWVKPGPGMSKQVASRSTYPRRGSGGGFWSAS